MHSSFVLVLRTGTRTDYTLLVPCNDTLQRSQLADMTHKWRVTYHAKHTESHSGILNNQHHRVKSSLILTKSLTHLFKSLFTTP